MMIGYNDWHVMYPAAGASFGIWAGIMLGWISSGIIRPSEADRLAEGLA